MKLSFIPTWQLDQTNVCFNKVLIKITKKLPFKGMEQRIRGSILEYGNGQVFSKCKN